jgi:hypothetical protein
MTDKFYGSDQTVPEHTGDKPAEHSNLTYSGVMTSKPDKKDQPEQYNQKDVAAAQQFVRDAEKLLGKMDIDHKPGISRADIVAAEGKKNLSELDKKAYLGLANMEPNLQTAWEVPFHRAHLEEQTGGEWRHSIAKLERKGGDGDLADRYDRWADQFDRAAKNDLAADQPKQAKIYFDTAAIKRDTLNKLQDQIDRVEVAVKVLPVVQRKAAELLHQVDPSGHGVTAGDLQKFIVKHSSAKTDGPDQLSIEDSTLLHVLAHYGRETGRKINSTEAAEALRTWAVGETRTDKYNTEHLFFCAIEGYNGHGQDVRTSDVFRGKMNDKDTSQLIPDRQANNHRSIPTPPQ